MNTHRGQRKIVAGEQVAIVSTTRPQRMLGNAVVDFVGPALTRLNDGRIFFTQDGLSENGHSAIIPLENAAQRQPELALSAR